MAHFLIFLRKKEKSNCILSNGESKAKATIAMKSLKQVPKFNSGVRKGLKALAFYERFEHLVALALTFIISVIVMVALFRLTWDVFELLLLKSLDPLDHQVFQSIFGGIMTLLIAMEFKHSILAASRRHHNIIQVKTVLLISLLALSRKFIILDLATVSAGKIASLAAALLALGCVYWMVRLAQDREAPGDQA